MSPLLVEWFNLDIWIAYYDLWTPEAQEFVTSHNKTYWSYSTQDGFPSQDVEYRDTLMMAMVRGWTFFHYDIGGFLHWVFYWNMADTKTGGWGYSGMGEGTVIVAHDNYFLPTLRLSAYRDGMQDYELMLMLNNTITKAKTTTGVNASILAEAQSAINSVLALTTPQPRDQYWTISNGLREFNHDPSQYIQARIRMGNALDALLQNLA